MSIDYDLFVIDPANQNTTPEQLRDCVHDALREIDLRVAAIENHLGIRRGPMISLCRGCFCMTHTINGRCGKCGAIKNTIDTQ